MTETIHGELYEATKNCTHAEVTKAIRAAIKAELPWVKAGVTKSEFAGGWSVTVEVKEVPAGFQAHTPAYLWASKSRVGVAPGEPLPSRHTPEGSALLRRIDAIVARYNYDGSDLMSDYFHVRFYAHVEFANTIYSRELSCVTSPPPYVIAHHDTLSHREAVEALLAIQWP